MSEAREIFKLHSRLFRIIRNATERNPFLKRLLGQEVIELVKRRTKAGFGVEKKKNKQLKIKDSTKDRRRRLRKSGKLAGDTTPTTANFTQSGETLDGLTYEVTEKGVVVKPGKDKDKTKLKEYDFNIMDVTKREEQALANIVAKEIVKALKKLK